MAKSKRSAKLDSVNARKKLVCDRVHQESLNTGQYLAYRRGSKGLNGVWYVRWWNDDGKIVQSRLGFADDNGEADGDKVLNYSQALAKAFEWFKEQERRATLIDDGDVISTCPCTVADAIKAYFKDGERRGVKGIDRDKQRAGAWIIPPLGNIEVSKLSRTRLENWLDWVANSPKRLRTRTGTEQKYAQAPKTDNEKRARKDSANRVLTVLKAALTFAVDRRLVAPNERPWELVKPYKGTTNARIRVLNQEEQIRLVNVCPPEFRALVRGALFTGCRYGELARIKCKDYDPKNGSIFIAESKSGKPRHVYLTEEGKSLFDELTAKPDPESHIFTKSLSQGADGGVIEIAWGREGQTRFMKEACKKAGVGVVSFHELRHTYASMLVNRGCLLSVVAQQLGHSDTRMVERHYAHLAPNTVRNEVLKAMPTLGILEPGKVSKLNIAKSS